MGSKDNERCTRARVGADGVGASRLGMGGKAGAVHGERGGDVPRAQGGRAPSGARRTADPRTLRRRTCRRARTHGAQMRGRVCV